MTLEVQLLTCDVSSWLIRQAVIFDWFDGPRQGICALSVPECEFAFDCLAERYNPSGLDDRLYRLREVQKGTINTVVSRISALGSPLSSIWVPVWRFSSEREKELVDADIDELLENSRLTNVIVHSQDLSVFLGCWNLPQFPSDDTDWFSLLGISNS